VKRLVEDTGLFILSVVLFLGGAFLLSLQIPFWSMVLGIASVQIGIVLIILTFDSLIRKRNKPLTEDYKTVNCLICRSSQFVPKYQKTIICDTCMARIAVGFKATAMVVFALITVTTMTVLVGQNQELRRRAAEIEKVYQCIAGQWSPDSCGCGVWQENTICTEGRSRLCRDGDSYCCLWQENIWVCYTSNVDK